MLAIVLVGLVILSLSRLGLLLWQWERVAATGIVATVLLQGVRVDLIQLGLLLAPLILLAPLLANRLLWRSWRGLVLTWGVFSLTLLVFMEAVTPAFILEYDMRPDRLFIEYLAYPKEVIAMIWRGFRLPLFAGLGLTLLAILLSGYWLRSLFASGVPSWSWKRILLTWPLAVLLVFGMIRSTTDHRPANPAMFALTADPMVNSLIINSTWSVFHAAYNLRHEARSSEIYGRIDSAEMLHEVQATVPWLNSDPTQPEPTLHSQRATVVRDKPLNLVIVLEESLGATFVESLGGLPVTPELERLKEYGWWFEQLYATGTRSVRGIEAVVSGYLPTPARSVVKLSKSQRNFFTLGKLLRDQGFHTEFIYGGGAHFDNMRSFFSGNGFDTIIDQQDYPDPVFTGSWGVSDEDLFNMAHQRISALHRQGKPFFSLVFTSSNHTPFEFPEGRIVLHDAQKATVNNAVKYADYALGQFFHQAMASDYWRDTLFLVVADHDVRVYGDNLVPIEHFQVPALILGADIPPNKDPQHCQPDRPAGNTIVTDGRGQYPPNGGA